ncbi:MAG TPA: zf-HC2 domain-containing protein [Candidatus Angelobacter sp.]
MNCHRVREILPLYLSGELRGADLAGVQQHFQQCRECAMAANADRELDDALRTAMLEETPDVSAVLSRVHEQISAPWWKPGLVPVRMAAAIAAIIVIAFISVPRIYVYQAQKSMALAAVRDHYADLVLQRHPDWEHTPDQVARFMQEQFPSKQNLLQTITPEKTSLEKVRLCNVNGTIYAHFVFQTGTAETSVFLRPNPEGQARFQAAHLGDGEHGLEVAGFSSPGLTGMVVAPQNLGSVQKTAERLSKTL